MESINQNEAMPNSKAASEPKKTYHPPTIQRFGSLADLVQFNAGSGPDGEIRWSDCTSL